MEHRSIRRQRALAIADRVSMSDLDSWWEAAFDELDAAVHAAAVPMAGPRAALYSVEYFTVDTGGEVVAYLPISREMSAVGRATVVEIPSAELAIAVHTGSFADLDRTYGALGTYVAEREIGVDGPIREHYLVTAHDTDDESRHVTEVGWPVFQTKPSF